MQNKNFKQILPKVSEESNTFSYVVVTQKFNICTKFHFMCNQSQDHML